MGLDLGYWGPTLEPIPGGRKGLTGELLLVEV